MSAIRKVLVRSQRYDDNPHSKTSATIVLSESCDKTHITYHWHKRDNWNSTPQSFRRANAKILSIIANVNVLQEHDREKQLTYDEAGQLHARWHFIKCKCLGKYIWRLVSSFKSAERYLNFVGPRIRMGQMIITLALTFSVSANASLNHKEQK